MGWQCENGQHEGYLVAVVSVAPSTAVRRKGIDPGRLAGLAPPNVRFRELGPGDHLWAADHPVAIVQIACDCGWRSARYRPPAGTTWSPTIVELPGGAEGSRFEEQARALWRAHVDDHTFATSRLDALQVVP